MDIKMGFVSIIDSNSFFFLLNIRYFHFSEKEFLLFFTLFHDCLISLLYLLDLLRIYCLCYRTPMIFTHTSKFIMDSPSVNRD